MKDYKFKIGDTVKIKDTNYSFEIKDQRQSIIEYEVDDSIVHSLHNLYTDSDYRTGWYNEQMLELITEKE